jgi:hypothetical protein
VVGKGAWVAVPRVLKKLKRHRSRSAVCLEPVVHTDLVVCGMFTVVVKTHCVLNTKSVRFVYYQNNALASTPGLERNPSISDPGP